MNQSCVYDWLELGLLQALNDFTEHRVCCHQVVT